MSESVRKPLGQNQIDRRLARIAQMNIRVGCKILMGFKRESYEVLQITEEGNLVVAGKPEPVSPLPVWSVE